MLEKHGDLRLTPDEERLILQGVIPERVKQNWSDVSLAELLRIVDNQRIRNGEI